MKEFAKICIKYTLISLPVGLLYGILSATESTMWTAIIMYLCLFIILYFMFNDIGKLIKSKVYYIYPNYNCCADSYCSVFNVFE